MVLARPSTLTQKRYGKALDFFRDWWKEDPLRKEIPLNPAAITTTDIRDYRDYRRIEKIAVGTPRERTRKATAVNVLTSPLQSFLLWCEQARIIKEAPAMPKRVKSARSQRQAVIPTDEKKLERVIERGGSKRDWAIYLVLVDSGLRVSELCALRWKDVCLVRGRPELYIWHGKGDKQDSVPLSPRARKALLELQREGGSKDGPVFQSRKHSAAITPRGVQNLFERYGRLTGVMVHPHMLRHSCATDMLNRGESVPTVQAVLRHRSHNTTLGYCHTTPEQIRKAVIREEDDE